MAQKKLKCPKCDRSFSMPAHLARHMTTTHGGKKKTKKKKVGRRRVPRKAGRVVKKRRTHVTRRGRVLKRASVPGLDLRNLSLEQLVHVIAAAREEATVRLRELEAGIQ